MVRLLEMGVELTFPEDVAAHFDQIRKEKQNGQRSCLIGSQ